MTTDRAPVEIPEEMVRAAAQAIFQDPGMYCPECKGIGQDENVHFWCSHCKGEGWVSDPDQTEAAWEQAEADAASALSAALRVVLSDPCPTCSGTGCDMHATDECPYDCIGCDDCHGGGTKPPHRVWAWLRVAQDAGMLSGEIAVNRDAMLYDVESGDDLDDQFAPPSRRT